MRYYLHAYKYQIAAIVILWILAITSLIVMTNTVSSIPEISKITNLGYHNVGYEQIDPSAHLSDQRYSEIYFQISSLTNRTLSLSMSMIAIVVVFTLYLTSNRKWISASFVQNKRTLVRALNLIVTLPLVSYSLATLISNKILGLNNPLLVPILHLLIAILLLAVISIRLISNHSKFKYNKPTKLYTLIALATLAFIIALSALAANFSLQQMFVIELFIIIALSVGLRTAIVSKIGI